MNPKQKNTFDLRPMCDICATQEHLSRQGANESSDKYITHDKKQ
jgi:hypothetical protein